MRQCDLFATPPSTLNAVLKELERQVIDRLKDTLLGAREIALLRSDAVFANVTRAALVDTEALAARLRRRDLTALLTVSDREPLEADALLTKTMLPSLDS